MALGERKEAEMKPTPRSARMGAIADALMAARNWADKAKVPEAVPLVGGQGLGSLVLGKAPEELTEMSYGNMPMRVNPLAGRTASYMPEMKPGRKEQVADLAMLAGVPKVGKAGVGLAGGADDVGRAAIAFHGTPHKFAPEPDLPLGRFRAEKIGSGEGAQAYGYGTYFAEAPGTAKGYQEKLSGSNPNVFLLGNKEVSIVGGSPEWKKFNNAAKEKGFSTESAALAYNKLKESKGDLDLASGELTWIDNPTKIHDDAANLLRSMNYKPQGGSFYTVDIPDEMLGKMLDWDKPLKDQPANVKKSLEPLAKQLADERNERRLSMNKQNPERTTHPVVSKLANKEIKPEDITGKDLYEFATQLHKKPEPPPSWTSVSADTDTRAWSGQQATSTYLKELGIPGIRYLDRQSRDVKEGTRNIVVFPGEESKVKILKRDGDEPKMAKGGMMKPSIPGFQDGGNAVEPTTGNDVPVGSLPNEVADDIPAKLSEGEFVLPADVVRFIGLERLMKMRDEAKEGLRRMAEIGQMGNAEEVGERSDDSYEENDDEFESNIDSIMAEMEKPENEQTERMMAVGGYMSGTDIGKAPKNPAIDVRFLRHADGRVMYITYIGGRPMTPIPEGFREVTREEAVKSASEADKAAEEAKKTSGGGVGDTGGPGTGDGGSPAGVGGANINAIAQGDLSSLATGTTVSPAAIQGAGVVGTILGIPGAAALVGGKTSQNIAAGITNLSGSLAGQQNITDVGKAFGIDTSTQEGKDQVSSLIQQMSENDVTGVPSGTSAQSAAMSAGTAASAAVTAAGGSPAEAAQASQSAVNAVMSGTSSAQAINDAVDAAMSSDGGTGPAVGDSVSGVSAGEGVGVYKKGGLVKKRQKPSKKQKGLASR